MGIEKDVPAPPGSSSPNQPFRKDLLETSPTLSLDEAKQLTSSRSAPHSPAV